MIWKLEIDVNDWVKRQFDRIKLRKHKDYNEESAMSDYMKKALKGSAKTKTKTNFGKPDFHVEKYNIPVIIEDKLKASRLVSETKDGIKFDDKSVSNFATNGVLHYARCMIDSEQYDEVVAIAIAGDSADRVVMRVYYVFGSAFNANKLTEYTSLDFLENEISFEEFYKDAILNEEEKHKILITSQSILQSYAKKLNKLMHNHNIIAPQRVLYVSGMLLAMQDIVSVDGQRLDYGLIPDDLKGLQTKNNRDGEKIVNHISNFLEARGIDSTKQNLMLASFKEISKDSQRDEVANNDKEVAKFINGQSSINKQVFTFIYEYIFKSIDGLGGHIDIMGEMYSEFLKYALGDGKEIGIVLTPPYVTKMMTQILGVDMNSKVMDLATGSAGFLISAMELMIEDVNKRFGRDTTQAIEKTTLLKMNNLLGIELNAEMYTLATTNMILRGDGSSRIEKGSAFNRPEQLFTDFKANRILLNPPFSFEENGLPFIAFGLDKMQKGGLGAIIIQDSAGSGKGIKTAKLILSKHTLLASIKMPVDLFVPMAGVQTSIYIFEAHKAHDYEQTVKFIDFRNDGYKRAKRGISEVDNPIQRYQDIIKIYKAGERAKVSQELWGMKQVYIEDFISENGDDWNFEQHQNNDIKPTLDDFKKTVSDHLAFDIATIIKEQNNEDKGLVKIYASLNQELESVEWREYTFDSIFNNIFQGRRLKKDDQKSGSIPFVMAGITNTGIVNYISNPVSLFPENSITIDIFGNTFYRKYEYGAGDDTGVYWSTEFEYSEKCMLFLTIAMQKSLAGKFSFGKKLRSSQSKKFVMQLPTINGKPDFDFMEKYITALEVERIKTLEAYLTEKGLKDYQLTKEDENDR